VNNEHRITSEMTLDAEMEPNIILSDYSIGAASTTAYYNNDTNYHCNDSSSCSSGSTSSRSISSTYTSSESRNS
jgi:hypothetical protein